jgi:hypothetical protein
MTWRTAPSGATFHPRDGQNAGGGPAADGQGAEAALVGRHLPAGVLDTVELPDPGQHRHQAQDLGRFLGIEPLRPDDPVHPTRILFVSKATRPYNHRVEPRRALKRLLGRLYRSLVTQASRSTKKDFLEYDLTESGAQAIRRRLKIDPGRFCRVAGGVTVHESMVTGVQYASRREVTFRMRRSIRPKQVKTRRRHHPEERGVKIRDAAQFGPGVGLGPG